MENQTTHMIFLPGDTAQQQEESGAPGWKAQTIQPYTLC